MEALSCDCSPVEGRFILTWTGRAGSDVLEVARQAWAWWKGAVGGKYGVFFFSLRHSGFKQMPPQGVTKGPERLTDLPKVTQAF